MISCFKRSVIILLIISVAAFSLTGGGTKEPVVQLNEQPHVSITLGVLKGPSGFGIIKLLEDNPDLGDGVFIEYVVVPSPAEMIAKLTSGEFQAGLLPLNVAAKLYSRAGGYPLAAVPGRGNLFIISRDPEVENWEDLEGKRIYAVGKGATPDYLFNYLAREKGIDPAGVVTDYTYPPTQLAQMAAAGQIDTVLIPQPFASLITMNNKDMEIRIDLQDEWVSVQNSDDAYPMTAFVVDPELAAQYPDVLEILLTEYEASIDWVLANPEAASAAIEKHGIMAAGPARAAIPACGLDFSRAVYARGDVEAFLTVLLDSAPQSIGGVLPDDGFYLEP